MWIRHKLIPTPPSEFGNFHSINKHATVESVFGLHHRYLKFEIELIH